MDSKLKGKYVRITEEGLESLEAEANSNIELKEFIPISRVDPMYFEHGYYLAPDQGGEKAYSFLSDAMQQAGRVALAEMVSHNKENLVLIRSAQGGLILQSMFYKKDIRDFAAGPKRQPENRRERSLISPPACSRGSPPMTSTPKPTAICTARRCCRCWMRSGKTMGLRSPGRRRRAPALWICMPR